MGTGDPVEEEQALRVVDLVLQRHGLEGVGRDLDPLPRDRQLPADDQPPGAAHVTGEVGHRHAPLPAALAAGGGEGLGVAQDEAAVARAGLGVARDVDAEQPGREPDLLGGQADAPRRDVLGGQQVRGELRRCAGRSGRPRRPARTARGAGPPARAARCRAADGASARSAWSRSPDVVVDGREVDLDAELGRGTGQVPLEGHGGVLVGHLQLGGHDVEAAAQAGAEVDDVRTVLGDDPGDGRDDARPVRAVHPQRVRRAGGDRGGGLGQHAGVDHQRATGGQRLQGRLHRRRTRPGAHQQHHGEVPAQQRHGGVLEVAVQIGERRRDVRDDARAVVTEDGDGDDLLGHGRISWYGRLLTRRD